VKRIAHNAPGGTTTLMKAAAAELCTLFVHEPLLRQRFLEPLLRIADGDACAAEARLELELPNLVALVVSPDTQKGTAALVAFLRPMLAEEWPHVSSVYIMDHVREKVAAAAAKAARATLDSAKQIVTAELESTRISTEHGGRRQRRGTR
jgi:hypothetical protein